MLCLIMFLNELASGTVVFCQPHQQLFTDSFHVPVSTLEAVRQHPYVVIKCLGNLFPGCVCGGSSH